MQKVVRGQAVKIAMRLRIAGWDKWAIQYHLRAEPGYDWRYAQGAAAFAVKEVTYDVMRERGLS